jgi:hypothetical protein
MATKQDVYDLIDRSKYHHQAIREIIAMLPVEDSELDEWIGEAVESNHQARFIYLTMAALMAERVVQARHLEGGTALMGNYNMLGCIAWHTQGEVAEHLLNAVQKVVIPRDFHATALLVACAWCQEFREGVLPEGLLLDARLVARMKETHTVPSGLLLAIAQITEDEEMEAIIRHRFDQENGAPLDDVKYQEVRKAALALGETTLKVFRLPPEKLVPETPRKHLASGSTMQRAVARVGRNEPCPCGSGQKYKRCCIEKDLERLQLSSEVAGKTAAELQASPEPYLTLAKLEKTSSHELARFDPLKIIPDLRIPYLGRMAMFALFEELVRAFEILGCPEELEEAWNFSMWCITRAERKEIAERMLKIDGVSAELIAKLHPGSQLLLARDEPAEFLRVLDELSVKALQAADHEELSRYAYGLLTGPHRALGIFVARSMVSLLEQKKALFLFDQIQEARVRLNLPYDDPFSDIIDARFTKEVAGTGKEAEKLRAAQKRLQAKASEARQLQESLETLKREIERREKKQETPAPAVSVAPVEPRYTLQELREKVSSLKSVLRERNEERSMLRRELGQAHSALETLRQKEAQPTPGLGATRDDEDHLLLPGEMSSQQPVRILEFPRKFHATLTGFPQNVARAAITMLGRLAAGEQAAFVGVVRLKDCPNVLRQRIGIDHRLLFRLHADHVEVVDLINRKDLERRIKTL